MEDFELDLDDMLMIGNDITRTARKHGMDALVNNLFLKHFPEGDPADIEVIEKEVEIFYRDVEDAIRSVIERQE